MDMCSTKITYSHSEEFLENCCKCMCNDRMRIIKSVLERAGSYYLISKCVD